VSAVLQLDLETDEARRRRLLVESDELLDQVENLRLADRQAVPPPLREAIQVLQLRLGRPQPPSAPGTVRAAHELVLAVQMRLMALNPRVQRPRSHPGRPGGQPVLAPLGAGSSWKLLTLPPPTAAASFPDWQLLVEATVERAYERWAYAHHHVLRCLREGRPAARDCPPARAAGRRPLATLNAAWTNYWELRLEADRLSGRPARRAAPAAPPR